MKRLKGLYGMGFCLIMGTIGIIEAVFEFITKATIVFPIPHVGELTVLWRDYVLFVVPASAAWFFYAWKVYEDAE